MRCCITLSAAHQRAVPETDVRSRDHGVMCSMSGSGNVLLASRHQLFGDL